VSGRITHPFGTPTDLHRMWQRLCKAMDRLDLLAPDKYATVAQRLAERERVNGIVAAFVGSMDREALLAHCLRHEVPAGPIHTIADIFQDPQFAARQNLVEVFDSREGRVVAPTCCPSSPRRPAS
jgi:crotonobetainyl-CoA:carnitine CoA-transferase CaiB-like acyl-CoA transferase